MRAVGWNNITNQQFDINVNPQDAIKVIDWSEAGMDESIDAFLEELGNKTPHARVLDALTWIDFSKEAKRMITEGGRFAIRSNEVEFGLGATRGDARDALWNEEF